MNHIQRLDVLPERGFGFQIVKFSMLKQGDIDKLGIEGKTLVFDSGKLVAAVANMSEHTKDNIRLLKGEILHAYRCYLNVSHGISTISTALMILSM